MILIFLMQLIRLKPKSPLRAADALITRLINNSVQTGTVTAVCAGVNLTLFLRYRNNDLQDVACVLNVVVVYDLLLLMDFIFDRFFMLGKLFVPILSCTLFKGLRTDNLLPFCPRFSPAFPRYSNTLLANLNVRRSLQSIEDSEAAVSTGIVLTDPPAISVGFWPHISTRDTGGSRDLSTAREHVCIVRTPFG